MKAEEKAKAYDEVLNKLRQFIAKGVDPLITRADVQDFFPELAESEGEKVIKRITLCLEECVHSDVIRDYEKDECTAWLEKQKGNICGISPNSAWSEEDEQHVNSLLKRLDSLCKNKFERTRFAISEDREWLKSLRPQNTWKPSDEQIKAIRLARSFVVDDFGEHPMLSETLMELEEQLKKLNEGNV
jgi:preprotein translocase subunit SecA